MSTHSPQKQSPVETNLSPVAVDTITQQPHDENYSDDAPQPDDAIGEVLEWLAYVVVREGTIANRALAACAYDALGGLIAASWPTAYAQDSMNQAEALADGAVDKPAIRSVLVLQ